MHRRSVDFPEPEGPMTQTTSPCLIDVVMLVSTSTDPNDLRRSVISTTTAWPSDEVVCIGAGFAVIVPSPTSLPCA